MSITKQQAGFAKKTFCQVHQHVSMTEVLFVQDLSTTPQEPSRTEVTQMEFVLHSLSHHFHILQEINQIPSISSAQSECGQSTPSVLGSLRGSLAALAAVSAAAGTCGVLLPGSPGNLGGGRIASLEPRQIRDAIGGDGVLGGFGILWMASSGTAIWEPGVARPHFMAPLEGEHMDQT